MKVYHLAITVLVMACALSLDVSAAGMTAYDIVKKSEDLLDQPRTAGPTCSWSSSTRRARSGSGP